MLENSEYVTDDELIDLSQTTETQIISDLKNQLKPKLGIEVKSFIDQIKDFIGSELRQYLVVIEDKRNQKWDSIKNLSKQYITEYKIKINEMFDSIESEEELQMKHNSTLEEILENCKTSNDFFDKKVVSFQVEYIENEIMKTFDKFSEKFHEKLGVFCRSYEAMFEQSISSYQKVFILYNCLLWTQFFLKFYSENESFVWKQRNL